MSGFPTVRLRRLRGSEPVRRLARETSLSPSDFIYPVFVVEGSGIRREIGPMPGCYQLSLDLLLPEVVEVARLGISGVLIFGLPASKDPEGAEAYNPEGVVQEAVRAIKRETPELTVVTDVCLCEYTDHGHCGVLVGDEVDNDLTLELLARTAVSHAAAGADIVAPSAMMDGQVAAIRGALDSHGLTRVPSWPTRPSTPPPSTDPFASRQARRPSSATGAATRWTPPTGVWPCGRLSRTSRRGRTSSW